MKGLERRRHIRKNIEDYALIHINTSSCSIEKTGKVDNISFGGVCFKDLKEVSAPKKCSICEGAEAAVYFRTTPVSVFGIVARQESNGELAIKIRQSTDEIYWERITS